jgi:hypothetical protein
MALLGDLGRFVSMGRQRIAQAIDDGRLHVTVTFASGEHAVILTGYAPRQPIAQASQGRVTAIDYNQAHKLFQIALAPGAHDTAAVVIGFPLTSRKSVLQYPPRLIRKERIAAGEVHHLSEDAALRHQPYKRRIEANLPPVATF